MITKTKFWKAVRKAMREQARSKLITEKVMEKIKLSKEQKKRISEVVNRYMRIQRNKLFRKLMFK